MSIRTKLRYQFTLILSIFPIFPISIDNNFFFFSPFLLFHSLVLCQRPPQFAYNPSPQSFQPAQNQPREQAPASVPAVPLRNSQIAANAAAAAAAQNSQFLGSFNCPDDSGFHPHVKSCDKYWACDNGK